MNNKEGGPRTPDPQKHGNDEIQLFKPSHRPICPKCRKKARTFYTREEGLYKTEGYYCRACDEIVHAISDKPPLIHRMEIQEYLKTTKNKFDLILADPPWIYNIEAVRHEDKISAHYRQMSTQDICNLPVQKISEKKAVLFLWSSAPKVNEAMEVIQCWGFEYKTQLIWNKKSMGLGQNVRGQHEILLIGKKGNFPTPKFKPRSVFEEKRTDHSRKPVKSYKIIETMYPEAKKIELFARWVYPGWVGVGNEAEPKPDQEVHAKNQKKCMQKFEVEVI